MLVLSRSVIETLEHVPKTPFASIFTSFNHFERIQVKAEQNAETRSITLNQTHLYSPIPAAFPGLPRALGDVGP